MSHIHTARQIHRRILSATPCYALHIVVLQTCSDVVDCLIYDAYYGVVISQSIPKQQKGATFRVKSKGGDQEMAAMMLILITFNEVKNSAMLQMVIAKLSTTDVYS